MCWRSPNVFAIMYVQYVVMIHLSTKPLSRPTSPAVLLLRPLAPSNDFVYETAPCTHHPKDSVTCFPFTMISTEAPPVSYTHLTLPTIYSV